MVKPAKVTAEALTRIFYKDILTRQSEGLETEKNQQHRVSQLLESAIKGGVELPVEVALSLLSFMDLSKPEYRAIDSDYLVRNPYCVKGLCDPNYTDKQKLSYSIRVEDLSPSYYQSLGEGVYQEYIDYLTDPLTQKSKDWLQQHKDQDGTGFREPVNSLFTYLASVYQERVPSPTAVQTRLMAWFATNEPEECRRLHLLLSRHSPTSSPRSGRSESPALFGAVDNVEVIKAELTDRAALDIAKQKIGEALLHSGLQTDQTALQKEITTLVFNKIAALKVDLGLGRNENFIYVKQHIDLFFLHLFAQMGNDPKLSAVFDSDKLLVDSALSNAGVACGILSNRVLRRGLFACLQRYSKPQSNQISVDPKSDYYPKNFFRKLINKACAADKHHPIQIDSENQSGERFKEVLDLLLCYVPKESKELNSALQMALLTEGKEGQVVFEECLDKAFPGDVLFPVATVSVFMKHFDFFVLFLNYAKKPWPYLKKLFLASKSPLMLLQKYAKAAQGSNKQEVKLNLLLTKHSIEILFAMLERLGRNEIGQIEFDALFDSLKPFILGQLASWKTGKLDLSARTEMAEKIEKLFQHSEFITRLELSETLLFSLNDSSQADAVQQALQPYSADVCARIEALIQFGKKQGPATLPPSTPGTPGTTGAAECLSLKTLQDNVALSAVFFSWKQVNPFQRYWIKALLHDATSWLGKYQCYRTFFIGEVERLKDFSKHFKTKIEAEIEGKKNRYVVPDLTLPISVAAPAAGAAVCSPCTPSHQLLRATMTGNNFGVTPIAAFASQTTGAAGAGFPSSTYYPTPGVTQLPSAPGSAVGASPLIYLKPSGSDPFQVNCSYTPIILGDASGATGLKAEPHTAGGMSPVTTDQDMAIDDDVLQRGRQLTNFFAQTPPPSSPSGSSHSGTYGEEPPVVSSLLPPTLKITDV